MSTLLVPSATRVRPAHILATLTSVLLACHTPTPPRPEPPRAASRTAPPPPQRPARGVAPRGPDISSTTVVKLEVDSLERLTRRAIAMLPRPMVAIIQAKGRVNPALWIAKVLGINPLVMDSLDLTRPAAFALLLSPSNRGSFRLQVLAALPTRGDHALLLNGLNDTFDSLAPTSWGGIRLRREGKTIAWVRQSKGWLLVAPTARLLDSALRYVAPRAKMAPPGGLRLRLDVPALVRVARPLLARWPTLWPLLPSLLGKALGGLLARHHVDLEKAGAHLASLELVSFTAQLQKGRLRWQLDLRPQKGGLLSRWIAAQRPSGGFGLDVLPSGALLATSTHRTPQVRELTRRLVADISTAALGRITDRLPREVGLRGLLAGKRPASLGRYRRALRDLNLVDYRTSHGVYVLCWHLRSFFGKLGSAMGAMAKVTGPRKAFALYAPKGGGIGLAAVSEVTDARRHKRLYRDTMWLALRSLNRVVRRWWRLAGKGLHQRLGKRPIIRLVLRKRALRVGRVTVSSLSLRITWPRGSLASSPEVDRYRNLVGDLVGAGEPTWAWAHVGTKQLLSFGSGWRARMTSMVRAASGKSGSSLSTDPLFAAPLKGRGQGQRLAVVLLSTARLLDTLLDFAAKKRPAAASSSIFSLLKQMVSRGARRAAGGTLVELLRVGGGYRLRSKIPAAEMNALLASVGMATFFLSLPKSTTRMYNRPAKKPPTLPKPIHP